MNGSRHQTYPRGHRRDPLYDVARQVTDDVMGEGTYAEVNKGNPDPGVQAAIERGVEAANPEPIYTLSIWYASSAEDAPQTHNLSAAQVDAFVRPEVGFMHDMLYLRGEGVRKLTLEVKS